MDTATATTAASTTTRRRRNAIVTSSDDAHPLARSRERMHFESLSVKVHKRLEKGFTQTVLYNYLGGGKKKKTLRLSA